MGRKLLIAEDEEVIRKGIAKYVKLHTERFEKIYEAENGQEAIDLILQQQPDMLLLDVQMPVKTGLDVMKEAEKAGIRPVTVILSGYDEFRYAQQALKFGAREYLLKPVRAADILECLEHLADECFGPLELAGAAREAGNPLIQQAKSYVEEHFAEDLSLTETAEKLGISAGYLSTLFGQNMDCGFVDYLNQVRIGRACCYLEQNSLKTYEIAYKVGFRDEKYFSKVFKKLKGMTPKEYRSQKFVQPVH